MLLYNDLVPPFVATAPPVAAADYACAAFGACPSVRRAQAGKWRSSAYCVGPARTPAGISLCLDQALMLAQPASPAIIYDQHFQLEHLLHTGEHARPIDSAGTALDDLTADIPAWAANLLDARVADGQDVVDDPGDAADDRPLESAAPVSAVIPFVERVER